MNVILRYYLWFLRVPLHCVFQEADAIRKSADESKSEAISVKEDTNSLVKKVDETEEKIKSLENQSTHDQALTNQVQRNLYYRISPLLELLLSKLETFAGTEISLQTL